MQKKQLKYQHIILVLATFANKQKQLQRHATGDIQDTIRKAKYDLVYS